MKNKIVGYVLVETVSKEMIAWFATYEHANQVKQVGQEIVEVVGQLKCNEVVKYLYLNKDEIGYLIKASNASELRRKDTDIEVKVTYTW